MPATHTEAKARLASVAVAFGSRQAERGACIPLCGVGNLFKHEMLTEAFHFCTNPEFLANTAQPRSELPCASACLEPQMQKHSAG